MRFVLIVAALASACHGRSVAPPVSEPALQRAQAHATGPAVDEPQPPKPVVRGWSDARRKDRGIYPELTERVEVAAPDWLDLSGALVVGTRDEDSFLFVDGVAVGYVSDRESDLVLDRLTGGDADGDGIPDQLDILVGAKKAVLNNAAYGSPYREIDYPGGDVPREEGVCTDTVIRAVRNAGMDLQQTLHDDIVGARKAFPMVRTVNANIDHRRVKTLLPHFERTWRSLSPDVGDPFHPWLPGDVIFMQTMGDARPDHIGVVSDRKGASGAPLIINNWTDGYSTSEMDIARLVPVTHRFRMASELSVPAHHAGVRGVLERQGLSVPDDSTQLILVTSWGYDGWGGALRRYERDGDAWVAHGEAIDVTLGANGLARAGAKREGDRRAPTGVFDLGTAFGRAARSPGGAWAYRRATAADRFVDDPASEVYNTWQVADGEDPWTSAEQLDMYELGIVVEYNAARKAGEGSAIFLHTWQGPPGPTLGCTAMSSPDLQDLVKWLDPAAHPVLVQVVDHVFQ